VLGGIGYYYSNQEGERERETDFDANGMLDYFSYLNSRVVLVPFYRSVQVGNNIHRIRIIDPKEAVTQDSIAVIFGWFGVLKGIGSHEVV
jgi:hypothetical protein